MGNSPIEFSPFLLHGLYSVPLYIPLPWLGFSGNNIRESWITSHE